MGEGGLENRRGLFVGADFDPPRSCQIIHAGTPSEASFLLR
jgi:hypothetical protein